MSQEKGPLKVVCFQCDQPGHYARDCPKRPKIEQGDGQAEGTGDIRGTCQGRIFNLTKGDMGADPIVVQGTLFILDTHVHALIDVNAFIHVICFG